MQMNAKMSLPVVVVKIIFATFVGLFVQADQACPVIKHCRNTQWVTAHSKSAVPGSFVYPDEELISRAGHVSFITPSDYSLDLKFVNETNVIGNVNITFLASYIATRIIINVHRKLDYGNFMEIVLRQDCQGALLPTESCIQNFIHVIDDGVLILELSTSLIINQSYVLTFEGFQSSIFNGDDSAGAPGLRRSLLYNSSVVYTSFYMRNARSVFPCFDHPVLKAAVSLCIAYPSNYTVVASTSAMEEPSWDSTASYRRQCFQKTPPISIHTLGFALLGGYEQTTRFYDDIKVMVPKEKERIVEVIINIGHAAREFLTNYTRSTLPIETTTFVLVYSGQMSWTVANLGLLFLNGYAFDRHMRYEDAFQNLYRSVAQQWIGNVVTVRSWNEVCLQEGLAAYLSWMMMEKLQKKDHDQIADRVLEQIAGKPYSSYASRDYATDNSAKGCLDRPALFFYMISKQFGYAKMREFVASLLEQHQFRPSTLDDWDETLTTVNGNSAAVTNKLRIWFSQPGPVTLSIKFQNNTIIVSQNLTRTFPSEQFASITLYVSSLRHPLNEKLHKKVDYFSVTPAPEWVIADPYSALMMRVIYERRTYLKLLHHVVLNEYDHLNHKNLKLFADEFCRALLSNSLPQPGDYNAVDWRDIFDYASKKFSPTSLCGCCVTPPSERDPACSEDDYHCNSLKIVRSLFGEAMEADSC